MQQKLDVQELLHTARERTGLIDFGPADFIEGLTVLVDGINEEAEIRPDRFAHLYERVQRLLINRLWFAHDLTLHPEIMNEDEGSPVIIAALPRTGSTKLHRMLAATGDFQTMKMWQAHMFARIPGAPDGGVARRIQETRDYEAWMYATSPDILSGHPMFTDEAEEDQWLMEASFRHPLLFGMYQSFRYANWIAQADMRPTFEYYLAQIKYLQWQTKHHADRPWLVKNPNHFGDEETLSRIYKQPRFIVTHRDPVKCIPSITNAALAMRKLYSDLDSAAILGPGTLGVFETCAARHMAWRDQHPEAEILDLSFSEINANGVEAARKVYNFCGLAFTPAAEAAIRNWEKNNPREKHGSNVSSPESIGTTDYKIRAAFTEYLARFSAFL